MQRQRRYLYTGKIYNTFLRTDSEHNRVFLTMFQIQETFFNQVIHRLGFALTHVKRFKAIQIEGIVRVMNGLIITGAVTGTKL